MLSFLQSVSHANTLTYKDTQRKLALGGHILKILKYELSGQSLYNSRGESALETWSQNKNTVTHTDTQYVCVYIEKERELVMLSLTSTHTSQKCATVALNLPRH